MNTGSSPGYLKETASGSSPGHLKETACGASSRILRNGSWVHKRARYGSLSLPIDRQFRLHHLIYTILSHARQSGSKVYRVLFTPYPIYVSAKEYAMEAIDDSTPIDRTAVSPELHDDLVQLYRELREKYGIFPHDYELYLQEDGRVAMIDYDKFGTYIDDTGVKLNYCDRIYEVDELLVNPMLPDGFRFM